VKRNWQATLLGAVSVVFACSAQAEPIRIGGVGSASGLINQLAQLERADDAQVELVSSLGTTGGLRALEDGMLDIAVSGRELKPEELARGLKVAAKLKTPFVFITSHPRPNGLRTVELADLYRRANATWSDGAPMRLVLRPRSDSDTLLLSTTFPGMAAALEEARQRPELPTAATDQDNVNLVERLPSSLSTSTLTQVLTERPQVRLVALDGVEPTLENFESGKYPFFKPIYFVLSQNPKPAAQRFVAALGSPAVQSVLRAGGNVYVPQ